MDTEIAQMAPIQSKSPVLSDRDVLVMIRDRGVEMKKNFDGWCSLCEDQDAEDGQNSHYSHCIFALVVRHLNGNEMETRLK